MITFSLKSNVYCSKMSSHTTTARKCVARLQKINAISTDDYVKRLSQCIINTGAPISKGVTPTFGKGSTLISTGGKIELATSPTTRQYIDSLELSELGVITETHVDNVKGVITKKCSFKYNSSGRWSLYFGADGNLGLYRQDWNASKSPELIKSVNITGDHVNFAYSSGLVIMDQSNNILWQFGTSDWAVPC